jgi:hypothetical protein
MSITSDPLAGIDDIAWDRLKHAYGTAEDVPDALRGFLGTADDALDACDFVVGSLWHQGTVFSATAKVIPFLVALLEAPQLCRRGALTVGLVLIAVGGVTTRRPRLSRAIRRAFRRADDALTRIASRYPDLDLAIDKIRELYEGEQPTERALDFAQEIEGLAELELDPRTEPPAVGPTVEILADRIRFEGKPLTRDRWLTWDPLEGEAQGTFQRQVKLEAMCASERLPDDLRPLAFAFASAFVHLHDVIARALVPKPTLSGGTTRGYQTDTEVAWSHPSALFSVTDKLGPARRLEAQLSGKVPRDGFELERRKGRFYLSMARPLDPDAATFTSFLRAIKELYAERDRVLGP